MTTLTKKQQQEAAFAAIKINIDSIVETFFKRHSEQDGNSLWWSEKALAELSGIRSTLFFLYGEYHEMVKYVEVMSSKIINR